MRSNTIISLVLLALLSPESAAITITTTSDAATLAAAIFNGAGITFSSASYAGAAIAAGTFTDGPFGIGSGAILTSGSATGAQVGGSGGGNNGFSGSQFCGYNSFDASVLTVNVNVEAGYNGVLVNFILGSSDAGGTPDPVGIWLDGTQYAIDATGNQITATSPYIQDPIYITQPNNDMGYTAATPPLILSIPASPGPHTMVFAACDALDSIIDTGLLVNARGCTDDCPASIAINYVTTTTTVPATESLGTQTIQAAHTTPGTILVRVAEASTTSEPSASSTGTSMTSAETEPSIISTGSETSTSSSETPSSSDSATSSEPSVVSTEASTSSSETPSSTGASTSSNTSTSSDSSTSSEHTAVSTQTSTTSSDTSSLSDSFTWTEPSAISAESSTASSETSSSTDVSTSSDASTLSDSFTWTEPSAASTESSTTSAEPSTSESLTESPTEPTDPPTTSLGFSTTSAAPSTMENSDNPTESATSSRESQSSEDPTESTNPPTASLESPTLSTSTSPESEITSFEPSPTPSSSSQSEETPSPSESSDSDLPPQTTPIPQPTLPPFSNGTTTSGSQTPSSAVSTSTTPSGTPTNIPNIGTYEYAGCMGSAISAGFPNFDEVLTADDMTTAECVSLAAGRSYAGLYNTSCYAADTLAATVIVATGRCNLPCPGDQDLFCGGLLDPAMDSVLAKRGEAALGRRAAPSGILLTIYALADAVPDPPASTPTTTGDLDFTSTSTVISSESGNPAIPDPSGGVLPPFTEITTTIITVTYTTVCPTNPASLVLTETCVTLPYYPCQKCANSGIPSVEMTITTVDCVACGHNGEDHVTLTVPKVVVSALPAAAAGGGAQELPSATAPEQGEDVGGAGGAQPTKKQGEAQSGSALPLGAVTPATETEQAVPTGQVNGPGGSPVVTAAGSRSSACWVMLAAIVGLIGMI